MKPFLVEKFEQKHHQLASFDLPLPDERLVPFRQMAKEQNITMAICHIASAQYIFVNITDSCKELFRKEIMHFDELKDKIDVKDKRHFTRSCEMGVRYACQKSIAKLQNQMLVFEVQMNDRRNRRHRLLLKYLIVSHPKSKNSGEILLQIHYLNESEQTEPTLGYSIIDYSTKRYVVSEDISRITRREVETLLCIEKGMVSKQISNSMSISESTVEKHRHNLLVKTGAGNIAGALYYVHLLGFI